MSSESINSAQFLSSSDRHSFSQKSSISLVNHLSAERVAFESIAVVKSWEESISVYVEESQQISVSSSVIDKRSDEEGKKKFVRSFSNPDISSIDKTEQLTTVSSRRGVSSSSPSLQKLQSQKRNTPLVVPKVVRISTVQHKTVNSYASMAEEDGSKRRFDAQVDFPRKNHTSNSTQHHQNGSHRNGTQQQQQQQRYHPSQQHARPSPSASCNSSLPSSRISAKKPQSLGGSINSASVSSANNIHPTPLFQRLVSEEVQELKAYARIIETQNRRLAELERVHGDLEARLEVQSNRRMELEKTLEDRERNWAEQIEDLKKDREEWKKLVHAERTKNARLMDQVVRKDQDIHRMLQRKVSR